MADSGFKIKEDLLLKGVRLDISPFLLGKEQFSSNKPITTWHIVSFRIHVEQAIERILSAMSVIHRRCR